MSMTKNIRLWVTMNDRNELQLLTSTVIAWEQQYEGPAELNFIGTNIRNTDAANLRLSMGPGPSGLFRDP